MSLHWTIEGQQRREHFVHFGREVVSPGAHERDRNGQFDHAGWKALAAEEFWTAHVPTRYGGWDGTMWDFLAGLEGLSEGSSDFGFVLSAIAHAGLIQVLLTHGTDEQRKRLLPPLVSGSVGGTAATEAGGGSHVAAVRTVARRDGGRYLLSGEKRHITNAPIADIVLIVGRVLDVGRRDITLFLVHREAQGLVRGPKEDLLGQRTSPTGSLILNEVEIGDADIVGPVGDGLATLYSFLAFDRLMYAIAVAGQLRLHLHRALDHALTRQAFGQPLAEHELIQDKLVDMKLTAESARYMGYAAADALIRGDRSYSELASCAKLAASEGIVRAGVELIQIFGHAGYMRDSGIEQVLRDAVAIRIAGGTTEMQKKNIFKQLSAGHAKHHGRSAEGTLAGVSAR
jgi:isovaleryl-CoA dehydrogenase